jgi:hypothetical protein
MALPGSELTAATTYKALAIGALSYGLGRSRRSWRSTWAGCAVVCWARRSWESHSWRHHS